MTEGTTHQTRYGMVSVDRNGLWPVLRCYSGVRLQVVWIERLLNELR
jgi:hypothetical protein